jgi:hypothetical protein
LGEKITMLIVCVGITLGEKITMLIVCVGISLGEKITMLIVCFFNRKINLLALSYYIGYLRLQFLS